MSAGLKGVVVTNKGGRPRGSEPKQIGKDRWLVKVSFTEKGRRVYRKATRPTKQLAKDWLTAQLNAVMEEPDLVANDAKTFRDLRLYFQDHYACEPVYDDEGTKISGMRSWKDARRRLVILGTTFDNFRLGEIRPEHIERHKKNRLGQRKNVSKKTGKKTLAWATVHRELALLRKMLNVAIGLGWLRSNPAQKVPDLTQPSKEKERRRVLTKKEFERLYAACRSLPVAGERLALVVLTAVQCGLRWGEIATLTWDNVDLKNGTLTITAFNAKSARQREVGIPDRLHAELVAWKRKNKPGETDRVFDCNRLNKSFERARKKVGMDDVRFHDLRHTFVTWLIESKQLTPPEVGRLAGHVKSETTYKYINPTQKTTARGRKAMNKIFHKKTTTETQPTVN